MSNTILIRNARIVNEGKTIDGDVLIKNRRIEKIAGSISLDYKHEMIDANGQFLLPGAIDDQVHFREPGLTHKADIASESRAAVAGGITSFMEMPNTNPQAVTQQLLEEKYQIASRNSPANYSFYMGATNDNIEEVLRTNRENVCGVKVFMGSSTGNMLVDSEETLNNIFSKVDMLIATHCEDEATIRKNLAEYKEQYGDNMPISMHPQIRSEEACYISSSMAVRLAQKHGTRLHILHISTAKELELFKNNTPLSSKKITSEACIHHLWFDESAYDEKGAFIKWNPAVKAATDREAIFEAVLNGTIDVIATDHAPHTLEEKQNNYWNAPSGGPLVQHALPAMLEFYNEGKIGIEKIAEKMSHAVADCFRIKERGYIREGYWADLALIKKQSWTVSKENILYKCGWSPFEEQEFSYQITDTIVSGKHAYKNGRLNEVGCGERLAFL